MSRRQPAIRVRANSSAVEARGAASASRGRNTLLVAPTPAPGSPVQALKARTALMIHLRHLPRHQPLQEPPRVLAVEERVRRLDAEEEAVAAREGEARHVEDGMVG